MSEAEKRSSLTDDAASMNRPGAKIDFLAVAKLNSSLLLLLMAATLEGCDKSPNAPARLPNSASQDQAASDPGRYDTDPKQAHPTADGTLDGSVFIVTKAAENIKLGLGTIYVCDESTATAHLQ